MSNTEKKNKYLMVRLTEQEMEDVSNRAKSMHTTLAGYIRYLLFMKEKN